MPPRKIYFASDFHLGTPDHARSLEREKTIVAWLHEIRRDAGELYLLGDVFDFWFEYRRAVPRGFVRLLGALASFSDAGIPVHYFTGNHDMWVFDYLEKEAGCRICRQPVTRMLGGKKFHLAHGDGIGPGDLRYKFIKRVFSNPLCQWLFARIHPNAGIGLAKFLSGQSRTATEDERFYGEKERQVIYSRRMLASEPDISYFIYGHRHIANDFELQPGCRFINLGDWISLNTYAVFDGENLALKTFRP